MSSLPVKRDSETCHLPTTAINVQFFSRSFFLRSSIGGVAHVTVFNSSATWAATFHLRGVMPSSPVMRDSETSHLPIMAIDVQFTCEERFMQKPVIYQPWPLMSSSPVKRYSETCHLPTMAIEVQFTYEEIQKPIIYHWTSARHPRPEQRSLWIRHLITIIIKALIRH